MASPHTQRVRPGLVAVVAVAWCAPLWGQEPPPAGGFDPPPLLAPAVAEAPPQEHSVLPSELPAPPEPEQVLIEPIAPAPSAEPVGVPASQHPWGKFEPGAWRHLRITSEAFDSEGQFVGRSVTERIERLAAVDDQTYTLRSETIVDIGGRRAPGPTDERRLALLTDSTDHPSEVVLGEPAGITLGGQVEPCVTWESTTPAEVGERRERVSYSADRSPYVLRREQRDFVDGEQRSEMIESVVRVGLPVALGKTITPGWHTNSTRQTAGGARSERFTVHSEAVPGGVVSQSEAEYDPTGRRVRWTVTSLVASGKTAGESQPGVAEPETASSGVETRPRRLLRLLRRAEEASQGI